MSWHIQVAGKGPALVEALEKQAKQAHSYTAHAPSRVVIDAHVAAVKAIAEEQPTRALSVLSTGHIDSHSVNAELKIQGINLVE